MVGQIGESIPAVWDNFDMDKVVREIGDINGMSPELKKSIEERDTQRKQVAKAQQAQQQMEMMQQTMDGMKTGAEAERNIAEGESLRKS